MTDDNKPRIKKVNEFRINQLLSYDGQDCFISKFPTRNTVVLESLDPGASGWSTFKTTIEKLRNEGTDVWGRPLRARKATLTTDENKPRRKK